MCEKTSATDEESTPELTLQEAVGALLTEFHMDDWIYNVRCRALENGDGFVGNSWDHPDVIRYSLCLDALREYQKSGRESAGDPRLVSAELEQKIRGMVPWAGEEYQPNELLDIVGRALDVAEEIGKERSQVLHDASVVDPDSRGALHQVYSDLVEELEYQECTNSGEPYESAVEPGDCPCGHCQLHRISDRLWAVVGDQQ